MSNGPTEGISWFKIVMFGMVVIMLAGIASVILDSGYGSVDESRRLRHPAGFSMIYPQGWGGTLGYRSGPAKDEIRFAPERVAGRQTSIRVVREGRAPKLDEVAKEVTFQNKQAWATFNQLKRDAIYRLDFERGGVWYWIVVTSPIALEWDRDPLMKFVQSFQIEAPVGGLSTPAAVDVDAATTEPTTAPAAR